MLENMTIGQYFSGDSALHRMDPRAKLLLIIAVICAVFMADTLWGYALLFLFVGCAAWLSRIDVRYIAKGLKPVYFIVLMTFVINLLFTGGEDPIFVWWIFSVTRSGLAAAAAMATRLVLLIFSTQLLTLTTSPIALTDGLEHLMMPLSKIGFPAHELAMMMSIALRFIPTLVEETDKIMKAQKARGADFETGNLIQRAKAMLPLLVPLFVSAFRRADELALAMEARCYRGGENRTRLKVLKYGHLDAVAALVVALLLAATILL